MPSTAFDSFYFKDRFSTGPMRAIWDDRATQQRWLDVEAALAEVEAELGLIPEEAAAEIAAAARIERMDLDAMKAAGHLAKAVELDPGYSAAWKTFSICGFDSSGASGLKSSIASGSMM